MKFLQSDRLRQLGRLKCSKVTALMMAAILCFTSLSDMSIAVSSAVNSTTSGGFELDISWSDDDVIRFNNWTPEMFEENGIDQADVESEETFVSYSEDGRDVYVTMRVHYRNNTITTGYDPGKITITVPGLRGAFRNVNDAQAAEVAADPAGSTSKEYNWSYTYTKTNDTYTFTNNYAVEKNSVFDGYFELAWKLDPRKTTHGYKREGGTALQAELYATGVNVQSNSLNYQQYRAKDEYELTLKAENPYKYEVPLSKINEQPSGDPLDLENYIWVKYSIGGSDTYKARDLADDEEFRLYFPADAAAVYMEEDSAARDWGKIDSKTVEDVTYQGYTVTKNITFNSNTPYLKNIFVAYPKEIYEGLMIPARAELWGRYYDEKGEDGQVASAKALIVSKDKPEHPDGNYGYEDIPADIYDVYKVSHGIHNAAIDRLVGADSAGAIDAQHLRDGSRDYTSDLELYLSYDNMLKGDHKIVDGEPTEQIYDASGGYSVEFVDDFLDIQTINPVDDGLRKLEDSEYHFTSVDIMPSDKILNDMAVPIEGVTISEGRVPVEVWVRYEGEPYTFAHKINADGEEIDSKTETDIKMPKSEAYRVTFKTTQHDYYKTPGTPMSAADFQKVRNTMRIDWTEHYAAEAALTDPGDEAGIWYYAADSALADDEYPSEMIFYYDKIVETTGINSVTNPIFTKVSVKEDATEEEIQELEDIGGFAIYIEGYAVQKSAFQNGYAWVKESVSTSEANNQAVFVSGDWTDFTAYVGSHGITKSGS